MWYAHCRVVVGMVVCSCASAVAQDGQAIDLNEVVTVLNREHKAPPRARPGTVAESDIIWGPRAIMVTSFAEDWEAEVGRSLTRAARLRKRPGLIIVKDEAYTAARFNELKALARAKKIEVALLDGEAGQFTLKLALVPPLNINTVTQEELEKIPGIGATTAAAIVAVREQLRGFKSAEDLLQVPGLGQKKIQSLLRAQLLIPQQ